MLFSKNASGTDSRQIIHCKNCFTPNSRPRIVFNEEGICNACINMEQKQKINWDERQKEFLSILQKKKTGSNYWDCIVPWSGGKDSSAIAWRLKYEYNMNPLLVTFSPMIPNDVGMHNREALLREGFDQVYIRPNQKVMRRLARRFFIERGNPKVVWEAGKEAVPVSVAAKYKIPLIFYAEHGESEYGGKVLSEESKRTKDFTEVIEHLVGDDARNWEDDEISEADLNFLVYPEKSELKKINATVFYFGYFFKWSVFENYEFIKQKIDFQTCAQGRTVGTFTNYDSLDDKIDDLYYYMQFVKFGFGRCVRDAARHIQNGHINREKGFEYIKKYDGEFPSRWLDEVLEYLDMDAHEFFKIIDKHRNPEIWKYENDAWRLRFPISELSI